MRDLRPYRDAAGQRSIQSALKLWPAALLLLTLALVVRGQEAKSPLPPQILVDLNGEIEAERLDALVDLAGLIRSFSETDRHRSITAVIPILINSKSPLERALAARVFEYAGDAQSGPALLEALSREKETAVIKAILYALARVPIPERIAALTPLTKHKDPEIRATSTLALAAAADPATLQTFITLLADRDEKYEATRAEAVQGLLRLRDRAALPFLLDALMKDESAVVRRRASEALGLIATRDDQGVISELRRAILSPDPYLSEAAATALARIMGAANN